MKLTREQRYFKLLWDAYAPAKVRKPIKPPKVRAPREHRVVKGRAAAKLRRIARESASGEGYTKQEFIDLCTTWGNRCLRCQSANAKLVPDHVKSLYRGGSHGIENIQPLCWKCNLWKGTRDQDVDFRVTG